MGNIYVSGPMTGLPSFNFPAFDEVSALLRSMGATVFSPADNDRVHWAADGFVDVELQDYFIKGDVDAYGKAVNCPVEMLYRDDFNFIINEADTIVLLPGWERSTGARYELILAEALSLDILIAIKGEDGWGLASIDRKAITEYLRGFPEAVALSWSR